jgi:hypothetical protein
MIWWSYRGRHATWDTRPATNLTQVYYPASGIVDTVGRGGRRETGARLARIDSHVCTASVASWTNDFRRGVD